MVWSNQRINLTSKKGRDLKCAAPVKFCLFSDVRATAVSGQVISNMCAGHGA